MTICRESLRVNGWELNIQHKGKGTPVLVLHGEEDGAIWWPWLDAIAERAEVIVPEHPGFGTIDRPDWLNTIHDLAYFYLDYMAQAKLAGLHVVGTSLGGWLAAELAIRDTHRIASLTLIGATGIKLPGVHQADSFLGEEKRQLLDMFYDPNQGAAPLLDRIGDPTQEDGFLRRRETTARLCWQPRNHDPHLAKWLHRIDVPTLLIWGEADRYVPKEHAFAFKDRIAAAEALILPRCGHLPHIEQPTAVVQQLQSFITGKALAS